MASRLEQLQKLLAADPADVEVHYMVAMEYKSAGDTPQALAKFEDCLKLNPNYAPAYFQMGSTHIASGDLAQGRETLQRGIQAARDSGDEHAAAEMQELLESL